ncbi:nucleotidyltransferase domain-containing protein [Nocardioides sp. NPDC051685]|uniref:nucleotidyltransferase domain-containing protein n=1 Tax=Nocardioides sp. NPDC051685 TaxID=3364334 RepID=UPI0037B4AF63
MDSAGRAPLVRTQDEVAADEEFFSVYGPWAPLTPAEVARELAGFDRPWWVVGGWAIEAATGYRREHEDTDISLLSSDVPALVEFLAGRWHVWNNVDGVLHPLGERWTDVDEPDSQLWLRRDASSPWVLDIPLTPVSADGRWTNKRVAGHVAEIDEVTWVAADGIRYLRPEIVLAYKARLRRPKDEPDLEATLPVLPRGRLAWLSTTLREIDPGHPWISRLQS